VVATGIFMTEFHKILITTSQRTNATGGILLLLQLAPGRGLANATGLLASITPAPNPQATINSIASNIKIR